MKGTRVLVIDDEAGLRHTLELILQDEGCEVLTASDGEDGLRVASIEDPDLILLRVDVEEAEYWDMASKKMVSLFHMAKALVGKGDRGGGFSGHGTIAPSPGGPA